MRPQHSGKRSDQPQTVYCTTSTDGTEYRITLQHSKRNRFGSFVQIVLSKNMLVGKTLDQVFLAFEPHLDGANFQVDAKQTSSAEYDILCHNLHDRICQTLNLKPGRAKKHVLRFYLDVVDADGRLVYHRLFLNYSDNSLSKLVKTLVKSSKKIT